MEQEIKEIFESPFWASLIIFVAQIVFIYLRTLNIIYTSEKKVWPAIISGFGIGLSWLVSMSIGVHSVLSLNLIPILLFLLGGGLGTYLGIKQNIRKNK